MYSQGWEARGLARQRNAGGGGGQERGRGAEESVGRARELEEEINHPGGAGARPSTLPSGPAIARLPSRDGLVVTRVPVPPRAAGSTGPVPGPGSPARASGPEGLQPGDPRPRPRQLPLPALFSGWARPGLMRPGPRPGQAAGDPGPVWIRALGLGWPAGGCCTQPG